MIDERKFAKRIKHKHRVMLFDIAVFPLWNSFAKAKEGILPYLKPALLNLWSAEFFKQITK